MKNLIKGISLASLAVLVFAYNKTPEVFKGFKKMDTGAYMSFYKRGNEGACPRIGDGVSFEMAQYFNDTLLFTTAEEGPIDIVLQYPDFVGDVADALMAMHVGDSARLVVLSDSVFTTVMQVDVPAEYMGKPIYYDLKLLSVTPSEELEAAYKEYLDSLMVDEQHYLEMLTSDPNNTMTESGLIILEKTGKGTLAQLGDFVDFDFLMLSRDGDTIMNSFDVESVDMQYGEEFMCSGFNEALGMIPQGGSMRFVIPSQLGFDSIGYEHIIAPYEPMIVTMRMNEVMNKEAHDKKVAAQEAKDKAEKERIQAHENAMIQKYVNENGITVEPTESGLYIIRKEEGQGKVAQWGDRVVVHYSLSNLNGQAIESSYEHGSPISFKIGNGEMIAAIDEALMTMSPGAKVTLVTPSDLAFGEFVIDEKLLPAYTPLVIDLELVKIE